MKRIDSFVFESFELRMLINILFHCYSIPHKFVAVTASFKDLLSRLFYDFLVVFHDLSICELFDCGEFSCPLIFLFLLCFCYATLYKT